MNQQLHLPLGYRKGVTGLARRPLLLISKQVAQCLAVEAYKNKGIHNRVLVDVASAHPMGATHQS